MRAKLLLENLNWRVLLGDLGVEWERINVWTAFNWLRLRTNGGLVWIGVSYKAGYFLTSWATISFSRRTLLHGLYLKSMAAVWNENLIKVTWLDVEDVLKCVVVRQADVQMILVLCDGRTPSSGGLEEAILLVGVQRDSRNLKTDPTPCFKSSGADQTLACSSRRRTAHALWAMAWFRGSSRCNRINSGRWEGVAHHLN
jgi:hypothetical protein